MKKGIHDVPFLPKWEFEKFIGKVAEAKFDGIELNIYENEGFLTTETSLREARFLLQKCKSLGIEIPSLSTGLHNKYSLSSTNFNTRKRGIEIALHMIELAAEMESQVVQLVPGTINENMQYDRAYELAQESISHIASEASRAGIIVAIENVCNKFLPSPLEFLRFIDEINHPNVQAYLDIGNAMVTGHPEHFIQLLNDRIFAIHAKDYRLSTRDFAAPLSGDVDWAAVITALHDVNYDGYFISTPNRYMYCTERLIESASSDLSAIFNLKMEG